MILVLSLKVHKYRICAFWKKCLNEGPYIQHFNPLNNFDASPPKSKIQVHDTSTFLGSAQVQDLCILEEVSNLRTLYSTFQPHPAILMPSPKSKMQVHDTSTFPENAQKPYS